MGVDITENIFSEVYDHFKESKHREAFDLLDTEAITAIIVDNNTYWFEWSRFVNDNDILIGCLPIKNYLNNKGLLYLYD